MSIIRLLHSYLLENMLSANVASFRTNWFVSLQNRFHRAIFIKASSFIEAYYIGEPKKKIKLFKFESIQT